MQGAEHQVSGFCGGEGQADGFPVPQLPDHNHIRVFAQRRSQRTVEAMGVTMHLALVDQAALAGMDKFEPDLRWSGYGDCNFR